MNKTVFYSWQKNLPSSSNRGFIETALRNAVKMLGQEPGLSLLEVDQATRGKTGAPDIAATLFEKIRYASALVADISIIQRDIGKCRTPNPNVLIEVGWGAAHLGWDNVVLCLNEHFGKVEELPFDLRPRRCMVYCVDPDADEKAAARAQLARGLEACLREIIVGTPRKNAATLIQLVGDGNPGLLETLSKHGTASVLLVPEQYRQVQALLQDTPLGEHVKFESNGNMIANSPLGMRSGFVVKVGTEFLELVSTA